MRAQKSTAAFALCIHDDASEDLERRKLYEILPDREAAREGYLRVVDESGEDDFYPSELFVGVRLPAAVVRSLMSTTRPTEAAGRHASTKVRLRAGR